MRTRRIVEPPRLIPTHNLFGDHGPLCPACSGLGQVLRLGSAGAPTRFTSKCLCGGTGVDREAVREREMMGLLRRLSELETRNALLMQKLNIGSRSRLTQGKNSRQMWEELIAWATADGTSVNTTAAETIVFPNVTIPANYMQDGRRLRLRLMGSHSTLGSGAVTVLFSIRWGGVGGTLICKTGAIVQVISLTAAFWDMDIVLQTRSNGATGTVMGNGTCRVFGATVPTIGSATGAPAVSPVTNGGQITPAVATLDLTADTALAVTVTMGASSASNIVLGKDYGLESLN